ncbi:MAG: helix-turn-helix domain-containing protein [Undibacterium sp.]|nr:helix-turn-helix domain-containing protein [Opitutaceae bacterium]
MKIETIMNCSSRIRLERQKRSWTQEQLAERAKLSTRTVQRIESNGESSAETLRLIAEAFGLPADSLLRAAPRMHFRAPWSLTVKVVTVLASVVILALPFIISSESVHWLHWCLWGAFVFCLFFSVNGFSVRNGQLLVHRLGWATKFELAQLSAFNANPHAMMGSIRLFGNGGLFGFLGQYRNAVIGNFQAYVTDPENSVVLEFGTRKIVISPDDPQAFVETLRDATKGICKETTTSSSTAG